MTAAARQACLDARVGREPFRSVVVPAARAMAYPGRGFLRDGRRFGADRARAEKQGHRQDSTQGGYRGPRKKPHMGNQLQGGSLFSYFYQTYLYCLICLFRDIYYLFNTIVFLCEFGNALQAVEEFLEGTDPATARIEAQEFISNDIFWTRDALWSRIASVAKRGAGGSGAPLRCANADGFPRPDGKDAGNPYRRAGRDFLEVGAAGVV